MKKVIQILSLIIIIVLGYQSIQFAFAPRVITLFGFLDALPLILLAGFTLLMVFFDISFYKIHKVKTQFICSVTGIILCCIAGGKAYQRMRIDVAATAFFLKNTAGNVRFTEIDCKADGHFILRKSKKLMVTLYYGKYERKGDTITLLSMMDNPYLKQLPAVGVLHENKVYFSGLDSLELGSKALWGL